MHALTGNMSISFSGINSMQLGVSDELSDNVQLASAEGSPYESTHSVAITEIEAPADDSDTMLEIRRCTTLTGRETTEQYQKIFMGTSDEIFQDESGAFYQLDMGYEQTTRQDEEFDYHDEVMLWEDNQNYNIEMNIGLEQSYTYRDLLMCNGDFELPLKSKDENIDTISWSTTSTIDVDDQIALDDSLEDKCW